MKKKKIVTWFNVQECLQMWNQLGSFRWCATVRSLHEVLEEFCGGANCAASLSLRRWRSRLRPLPLAEAFGPSAPDKCPFWLAAVLCRYKRRRSSTRRGLSGPASVSGWRRPRLCEGGRWRSEGRRSRLRRCPTRSCWLRPEEDQRWWKWITAPRWTITWFTPDPFFSPLRICRWCRGRRLRPLRCLARGTDSSTNSPGNTAAPRKKAGEQVEAELNIKSGEKWSSCQAKTVRRLGEEEEKLQSGVRSSQTLRERSPQTESDLYLELVQHKFVWFSRDSGGKRGIWVSQHSKRRLWHFCSPGICFYYISGM